MSKPIIEVENLGKRYRLGRIGAGSLRNEIENAWLRLRGQLPKENKGDFWALRDVSFTVNEGEVLGIIGRNGAGKSTLLKLLSRITEPTTGRAILRGRVASLLEVGTGFHPELSGRENIYLNGAILGMTRAEVNRKFDEIVDFSGVEQFLDTPVKRYSSGMRVRLGFAVAAHLEPEILIIDEVLAVGDASFQKRCLGKMNEVARAGRTILFVSHQMPMIQRLCSQTIFLEAGRVVASGDTHEIVRLYFAGPSDREDRNDVDLTNYPREERGLAGLKRVRLLHSMSTHPSVAMGDRFEVDVSFEVEGLLLDGCFGIGVEDSEGRRLFSLSNYLLDGDTHYRGTRGVVKFIIPELMLLPGDYWLSVTIVESRGKRIDRCERCLPFTVVPHDVYGSGTIPQSKHGQFYTRGFMQVEIN